MKKYLIFCILLSISASGMYAQKYLLKERFKANLFWHKNIVMPLQEQANLSIEVFFVRNNNMDNAYKYITTKIQNTLIYIEPEEFAYCFNDSIVKEVNFLTKELMIGKYDSDFYQIQYNQIFGQAIEYYEPFFFKTIYNFDYIKDSTIKGIQYKILKREDKRHHFYNTKTQEFDIPDFFDVYYYYNTKTKLVDYIDAQPMAIENNKAWRQEYFIKFVPTQKDSFYSNLFDFSNIKYKSYSRHNDNFMPYSRSYTGTKQSNLNDTVLNFPIVSLKGDTTTIQKEHGWLLLDFWFVGCSGCVKWISLLKNEQDSLGYRILEKNNIKILSINATSNNSQYLKQITDKLGSSDIAYHAKGIGNTICISPMPKYFLVSPDKNIVYTSTHLTSDYSALLKAKADYEKQHNLKP